MPPGETPGNQEMCGMSFVFGGIYLIDIALSLYKEQLKPLQLHARKMPVTIFGTEVTHSVTGVRSCSAVLPRMRDYHKKSPAAKRGR